MANIEVGQFWKHLKTGGIYHIEGFCMSQDTGRIAVLYQTETADDDKMPWVRTKEDFLNGRFERLEI